MPKVQTQQFIVKVKAPAGSKPGKYTCRLDVFSVANPEEDYTQGPTVSFEIAPAVVVKNPFPWWIVAAAAAVILVIGITVWLLNRTPAQALVPAVAGKGLTLAAAEKTLSDAHFKATSVDVPAEVANVGKVVGQDPAADTNAPTNKPVTLQVGVKGIHVPNVVAPCGDLAQTFLTLQNAGLIVKTNVPPTTATANAVFGQDPKPQALVATGAPITLTIGAKPQTCGQVITTYNPALFQTLNVQNRAMLMRVQPTAVPPPPH